MNENRSITRRDVLFFLPIIAGVATCILYLASMNSRLDLIQSQQIDAKAQLVQTSATIDSMKVIQGIQGQDIAVIKQILQHNNLTVTPKSDKQLALATNETPSNTSAQLKPTMVPVDKPSTTSTTTNNTTTVIDKPTQSPTKQSSSIPQTTQAPQPTQVPQPTAKPALCINSLVTLCI